MVRVLSSIAGNVELSTHRRGNDSGCSTVVRSVSSVERPRRIEARSAMVMAKSPVMHVRKRGDRVSTAVCATKRDEPGRKRFPCGEVVVGSRRRTERVSLSVCRLMTRTRQGAIRKVCRAIWIVRQVSFILLMTSRYNGNSAQYAESDIALACGSQKFIATLLFDLRCRLLLSLRSWIRKAFDCSPTNRERVMGLAHQETG